MHYSRQYINDYLWAGYLPPHHFTNEVFEYPEKSAVEYGYSTSEVSKIFDSIFSSIYDNSPSSNHIIPLSGGLDSRAILGALLDRVDPKKITTVTYGAPGQLDYEIGQSVAKYANVKHHAIDLRKVSISWESILESVQLSPWTGVPDAFFNQYALKQYSSEGDLIWTGFLGGLTGDFMLKSEDEDVEDDASIIDSFIQRERRVSIRALCSEEYDPALFVGHDVRNKQTRIPLGGYLHYAIHNSCYTAPIVAPLGRWKNWCNELGVLENNAKVIAPFANPEWAAYWLYSPRSVRKGSDLFYRMLKEKYSNLFLIPGKQNYWEMKEKNISNQTKRIFNSLKSRAQEHMPWMRLRAYHGKNYLDFDYMFRTRKDYQEVLDTAIKYLLVHNSTPWLDISELRNDHMKYRRNYGDIFCVLIGLAANLKVNLFERSTT